MELQGAGYLYTLATLAMTFVGFCAIVLIFRQSMGAESSKFHRYASHVYIELGFISAAFAMLGPLLAGRALFEIAPARWRPFYVDAGDARVRVVGTVFDVGRGDNGVAVTVVKGLVTVTEFFDYRCPYCKAAAPAMPKFLAAHRNVRFVYKEFPILSEVSEHAAKLAAQRTCSARLILDGSGRMIAAFHCGRQTFLGGGQGLVDFNALAVVVLGHHGVRTRNCQPQGDEAGDDHDRRPRNDQPDMAELPPRCSGRRNGAGGGIG